jgi:hypothetical protein
MDELLILYLGIPCPPIRHTIATHSGQWSMNIDVPRGNPTSLTANWVAPRRRLTGYEASQRADELQQLQVMSEERDQRVFRGL